MHYRENQLGVNKAFTIDNRMFHKINTEKKLKFFK